MTHQRKDLVTRDAVQFSSPANGHAWQQRRLIMMATLCSAATIRPEVTTLLKRGVGRALIAADRAVLFEMPLANGRRADVAALDHQGRFTIIEIKSGLADFQADNKWRDYLDYCDFFAFAVAADFPDDVLPEDEGLMIADGFGAEVVREPRHDPLSAARRKAMLIRFARAGAARLQDVLDPRL